MDLSKPYSVSLRRMLDFKLFPNINPETVRIEKSKSGYMPKLSCYNYDKRSDEAMLKIRKEVKEAKANQKTLDKEIDSIINKMADQGLVDVQSRGIKKHGTRRHLRIVTENGQADPVDESPGKVKLPGIKRAVSTNRIPLEKADRVKTDSEFEIVDASRYIKHYRSGMSSLRKINIRAV